MPRLVRPNADIEDILRAEFPGYWTVIPQTLMRGSELLGVQASPEEEQRRDKLRERIERRRNELLTLSLAHYDEFARLLTSLRQQQAAKEEAKQFFNQPRARADFAHWAKLDFWTLEEAVALCFGRSPKVVNPKSVESFRDVSPFARQFMDTLEIATRARAMNQIQGSNIPGFFIAWAKRMELPFPAELEALVAKRSPIMDWQAACEQWRAAHGKAIARIAELEQELAAVRAETATRWPWGSFETTKLRRLAAAAAKFWVNYDPAEPDTAPTNPKVANWLKQQGESPRIADAMATILRADNLKVGRRGK